MGQTLKEKANSLGISYRTAKWWRANGANLDDPSSGCRIQCKCSSKVLWYWDKVTLAMTPILVELRKLADQARAESR